MHFRHYLARKITAMQQQSTLEDIQDFKGAYPKQIWGMFFSEMWERFCFYGMRGMLTYFMVYQLAMDSKVANLQYGATQAWVYSFTFIGGLFADKILGFRKSLFWGGLMMIIGSVLLAIDPHNQSYRFLKAEWLWKSQSPAKAMTLLSKQEQFLDKNEIVNFLNKTLPTFSQRDWIRFCISLITRPRPAMNSIEATVLTRELSAMADARRTDRYRVLGLGPRVSDAAVPLGEERGGEQEDCVHAMKGLRRAVR